MITHSLCYALHFFKELKDECTVDTGLHKQTGSRNTCLARSDEGRKSRSVYNYSLMERWHRDTDSSLVITSC